MCNSIRYAIREEEKERRRRKEREKKRGEKESLTQLTS